MMRQCYQSSHHWNIPENILGILGYVKTLWTSLLLLPKIFFYLKDSLLIYKYKKNISSVFSESFKGKSIKSLISKRAKTKDAQHQEFTKILPKKIIYGKHIWQV